MNTRCPPKRVPSSRPLFSHCRLTMQPPKSYSVGGQRSSRAATGKPAGARPDYRGRWCAVSRGHPDRPNPPSPQATLGQLCAAPWELPSSIGKGIAWIRTIFLISVKMSEHKKGTTLPASTPAGKRFRPSSQNPSEPCIADAISQALTKQHESLEAVISKTVNGAMEGVKVSLQET
ncbi:UNVERIFIED_CONTAM: hypothetical protein FKN15_016152 [Acipenser sinensis]